MEIRTLLKANIKRKKGAFISVMILTLLITAMASAVLAVRKNYYSALERAQTEAGMGDANVYISDRYLTDEILENTRNSSLVKELTVSEAIIDFEKVHFDNGEDDGNTAFFLKMPEGIRLYTPDAQGFEDTVPALGRGEAYIAYGLHSKFNVNVGDRFRVGFQDREREFTIKGFVQEPLNGAMMIGWKQYFISDEDYDELYSSVKPLNDPDRSSLFRIIKIFKSDETLSDAKFVRQLNLETGISTKSAGVLTRDQSENYTGLLMIIIIDVVFGFSAVLFIIVLIVIAHSIRTEIEIDFANLGILKAQGFTDRKITQIIFLRYALAELSGMVLGIAASLFLGRVMSGVFSPITAILPDKSVDAVGTATVIAAMLLLSALIVFISTRRLARISPVSAISGGRQDVWFRSRLNIPISKRGLTASIAYRSFSSSFVKYVGIIFITVMLAFFTVTVNVMSAAISSRSALESMGMVFADVEIRITDDKGYDHVEEMEQIVEKYSRIDKKYYEVNQYYSLNGENIICCIRQYPENTPGMLKGRKPIYDNELIITEMVADALDLKVGDKVKAAGRTLEADFIVSGIFQSPADAGYAFSMSLEAAKRIGAKNVPMLNITLDDTSRTDDIAKEITDKFGDMATATAYHEEGDIYDNTMMTAADAMRIMIYFFSGIFALVAVIMVCSKAFTQERTDLGIYKAIGFTSARLRRQFAVRFFIIAVIGSTVGVFAGMLWSDDLLNIVFSMFGICKLYPDSTPLTYLGAAGFVIATVTLFALLVSRKVKKVGVRELVVE